MWYVLIWVLCFFADMALMHRGYIRAFKTNWVIGVLLALVCLMFAPYFLMSDLFRKGLDRAFNNRST